MTIKNTFGNWLQKQGIGVYEYVTPTMIDRDTYCEWLHS